jgi:hypothetical protein
MDDLTQIINTLTQTEQKEFHFFIQRQKLKKERKDLNLFKILSRSKEVKIDLITEELYGSDNDKNRNAYHTIRKRLYAHLTDFIVMKQVDNDSSSQSKIQGYLTLAQYLFYHSLDKLGWSYIKKAENLSHKSEQWELLHRVYLLQLDSALSVHAPPLKEIIRKFQRNKEIIEIDQNFSLATAIIKSQFKEIIITGRQFDFERVIQQVLNHYDLIDQITKNPKRLYAILTIIRNATLVNKDFKNFVSYGDKKYKQVKNADVFHESNHEFKLKILYMLAHAFYRNGYFDQSLEYLEDLYQSMYEYSTAEKSAYHSKYIMILAQILNYTGEVDEAIEMVEFFLEENQTKIPFSDLCDLKLNLSTYYFNKQDFKAANRNIYQSFPHSNQWYSKKKGMDWVLRKMLIELFIQFEMGNDDIALNTIRSLKRSYKKLFAEKAFLKARLYIDFIEKMVNNPLLLKDMKFINEGKKALEVIPQSEFGLTTLAFYAWYKSKLSSSDYYAELVETIENKINK